MKSIIAAALTIILLSTASAVQAQENSSTEKQFTYKGFILGDKVAAFKKNLPDWRCTKNRCEFDRPRDCKIIDDIKKYETCKGRNSFGGVSVNSGYASSDKDGRLYMIVLYIDRDDERNLLNSVKSAYGSPTSIVPHAELNERYSVMQWKFNTTSMTFKEIDYFAPRNYKDERGSSIMLTYNQIYNSIAKEEDEKRKAENKAKMEHSIKDF